VDRCDTEGTERRADLNAGCRLKTSSERCWEKGKGEFGDGTLPEGEPFNNQKDKLEGKRNSNELNRGGGETDGEPLRMCDLV